MSKITVVDNIMAAGKTSWSIEYINNTPENNYLYITPFLNEVQRIITGVVRPFVEPINKGSGKLDSLNQYLSRQQDIASTHELFKHLDEESKACIQGGHYTLILDEVLNVLEPIPVKSDDLKILQDSGCITIQEDGFVVWNPEKHHYDTRFDEVKMLAEQHSLLCINGCILLWRYPPEIFTMFDKVYILTYLFSASIMKYYFDACGIEYDVKSLWRDGESYQLIDYYKPDTSKYVDLLNIYDGDMNSNFYQKEHSLSKNWFMSTESRKDITTIKHNLYNYFRNILNSRSATVLWTTYEDFKGKLKGKGYTKGFVACNCRATNEYAKTSNLAYCVNIHVHPAIMHFFSEYGIKVDQEAYALSEMIQWIWRSAIRNDEPINIYIPSNRMRRLLKQWLGMES